MIKTSQTILSRLDPHRSPFEALVYLWRACKDHRTFQAKLDRASCLLQARNFLVELEKGSERLPDVHPAAALRAVDTYCNKCEPGNAGPRTISLSGNRYHVVRRPNSWTSKMAANRVNYVEFWMQYHQILPTVYKEIKIKIKQSGGILGKMDSVGVLTGGFTDNIEPRWLSGSTARCRVLADSARRQKSVLAVLNKALRVGAQVLVLPELTVDHNVLTAIQEWLQNEEHKLLLVAAGSFHVERDGKFFNTGWLLSGRGDILISHDKLQPMRHKQGWDEGIQAGDALQLLWTERGFVALAICLDFCEKSALPVGSLWAEVGPAIVLVPSMGEKHTNEDHIERARELWDQHATWVLIASQEQNGSRATGIACGSLAQRNGKPDFDRRKYSPQLSVRIDISE